MDVDICIAGGGIGGIATALAIARRGRRVHVLEKVPAFGELGAGIQLAPNAGRVLAQLGVLDDVERHAVFPQRILWMDAVTGEQLTSLDLGAAFRERYGAKYMVMHRSDLLDVLLEHARAHDGITLEANKAVVTVEDRGDRADVRCADGSQYDCALLVGADGLWSTVRRAIVDDAEPVCSEYVAYRGAIPIGDVSAHAGLDNVMLWTGPERHLVQYPIRRGELFNQVAVFRSHQYAPESTTWGGPEELDERFRDAAPLVATALTMIKRDRRWPMYDRVPLTNWTRNRITLIGDAAHPMLQYLAQGACQALEDADALAFAIDAHPHDLPAALASYQLQRLAHTARVQTTARAWGDWWHQPAHAAASRDAVLAARSSLDYRETDWLYGAAVTAVS